ADVRAPLLLFARRERARVYARDGNVRPLRRRRRIVLLDLAAAPRGLAMARPAAEREGKHERRNAEKALKSVRTNHGRGHTSTGRPPGARVLCAPAMESHPESAFPEICDAQAALGGLPVAAGRGVRCLIVVGGGRGGVGKSLVAQNLAVYFAQL